MKSMDSHACASPCLPCPALPARCLCAGATACAPQQPNAGFPFTVPYLAQQAATVATASRHLSSNRAVFIWMGANGALHARAAAAALAIFQGAPKDRKKERDTPCGVDCGTFRMPLTQKAASAVSAVLR